MSLVLNLGQQHFFDDWLKGDFTRIIDYCKSDGDAFQDIPFSLPGTFRHIDRAFPGSKFVLTIRNSADEWYNSLVSFHAKHFSESGSVPPTEKDLEEATYWRKGFIRDYCQFVLGTPINAPYEREAAINFYNQYNQEVMEYFESRSRDLLVLNVSDEHAYSSLCSFLGLPACDGVFPWENKT
ncbi:MAG: sulfotransferase [Pseudomonadales bacterium]